MDEHDPVDDGEFVYRRIHRSFFLASALIPIQFPAFRPNANDLTGISVFRAALAQPTDTLGNIQHDKIVEYYVSRLHVRELQKLGLSVVPEPLPTGPPGHAVIPELNWPSYRQHKQRWKPIIVELVRLASADVVHRPS
ncbi:MAG: hypothetical protein HY040_27365 [Planctomycetes bacterium]|nr:hypothetical protein [Planctomycetota bacterium]